MARPAQHPTPFVRVPKAAELVAEHLRKQIVRGELQQDDALPSENALMETFGVSRPTLREAYRILESEGLIIVRRGAQGGARVQIPSMEVAARYAGLVLQHRGATLADVFAARVIVEAPAAGIVARKRDRAQRATKLQEWLTEFESTVEVGSPGYNSQFHGFNRLLVDLTENETLVLVTSMLETISDAAAFRYTQAPHEAAGRMADRASRTRHKLIELIRAGDADKAEELFTRHLAEAGSILTGAQSERVIDLLSK
jgi:DNA-binding FadR family transcriptional regulator